MTLREDATSSRIFFGRKIADQGDSNAGMRGIIPDDGMHHGIIWIAWMNSVLAPKKVA